MTTVLIEERASRVHENPDVALLRWLAGDDAALDEWLGGPSSAPPSEKVLVMRQNNGLATFKSEEAVPPDTARCPLPPRATTSPTTSGRSSTGAAPRGARSDGSTPSGTTTNRTGKRSARSARS